MSAKRLTVLSLCAVALLVGAQRLLREPAPPPVEPTREDPPRAAAPRVVNSEPAQAETDSRDDARDTASSPRGPSPAADAARPPGADAPGAPAADAARRFVFDCGNGVVFGVRTLRGEATLSSRQALGSETVLLPLVESGPGVRYASAGVSYTNKGGLATFEIRDRTYADCTSNPGAAPTAEARRRSAIFRARGHEPAWQLEIAAERIEISVGGRRVDFPYREPIAAGVRTTYRSFVGTQELVVVIDATRCNDSMSGELLESAVTVTFENTTLHGCGQPP